MAVVLAYVATARLGFTLAFVAEQVSTVWAPTGIALAALLLRGYGLWPAVWIGAFLANAGTTAPMWTAAAVATGNTLEAVVAIALLRRLPGFDPSFQRVRDVVAFIGIAALMCTAISATIGVATLCLAAVQPWDRFSALWGAWWFGDMLGALVVAPAIVTLARPPVRWSRRATIETAIWVLGASITTHVVFGHVFGPVIGSHPLEYVIFPFVIGAAVRLGPTPTTLVVLSSSVLTIWNTARGAGPFAGPESNEGLILLQSFMGVLATTGLMLAAAMTERRTSERRRAAAFAVGESLATATSLRQAAPSILKGLCANLEWQVCALWLVDHERQRVRCEDVSAYDSTATAAFIEATRSTSLQRGVGLPGRVWATAQAAWIEDVVQDPNFPRAKGAEQSGLHGGFAFPIILGTEVLGVIECFNRRIVSPDPDLLRTMSTVGSQIGQFIGRKRVETTVLDEQRRIRAMLETALDAIIGMDHCGLITEFNPAAERMFGYNATDAIGRELADLIVPPDLREQHRAGVRRYLETGHGPFIDRRIETSGYHADGHEFPVEVAITRVADEDPPRFTGFVRDLTARAQAEREREQLLQRELTARREAEEANRAKDQFLATLSHELRTPLNAIVGWTRMLLDGTLDEEARTKALQVIDRNAHLQTQLVADILDVSRIITGGLRLNVRRVDLDAVLSAALDAVRPGADAKGVQLQSHVHSSTRHINGDPERLQQIIWNLMANAVKFTPSGGMVSIQLSDGPDSAIIRVSDTGVGIDPAFLPHVFERFRQADGSVTRQHGGLGLGLAIVRHLVELHGGTVRAESDGVGTGATFTVELPRSGSGIRDEASGMGEEATPERGSVGAARAN